MKHLRLNPYLLVTMVSWGFNFVAIKLLYREMDPATVSLVRLAIMAAVLVAVCLVVKVPLRYPKGQAWKILLQGCLSLGVYMIFFLEGMVGTSPAEGAILLGTGPIFTLLFAVVAKQERFISRSLYGILVAFLGVVLVVFVPGHPMGSGHLAANLMVLISAMIWALSTVLSRPLVGSAHPLSMLTLSMPGALVALIPYGGVKLLQFNWSGMGPLGWSMLAYVSLVAGVVGFVAFYVGVRQVGASGAMLYQYLVAPLAALSGWLFLGNQLYAQQFLGIVVVLGGVAWANSVRQAHIAAKT